MAEDTITVQGAIPGVVGLWEINPAHPNGEVFVTDKKPVEVAETALVMEALAGGRLTKAGASKGKESEADSLAAQRDENAKIEADRIEAERVQQLEQQLQDMQAERDRLQADANARLEAEAAATAEAEQAKADAAKAASTSAKNK